MNKKINSFLIVFFFFNLITFQNGTIFSKIGKLMFIIGSFIYILKTRTINLKYKKYYAWVLTFGLFSLISTKWAVNKAFAKDGNQTVILNFICIVLLSQVISKSESWKNLVLKSLVAFPSCAIIRLVLTYGINIFKGLRNNADSYYNAIGMFAAFGIVFGIYYILTNQDKKIRWKVLICINLMIVLISMSRKSLLFLCLPLLLIYLFTGENIISKIGRVFIIAICIFMGYLAIMKIPLLYNYIGNGIEKMFNYMSYQSGDVSAAGRNTRIVFGKKLFEQRPWVGYGTSNYNYLFGRQHQDTNMIVADNNYIDVLVNFGIIGFIIYYSIYIFSIVTFFKTKQKNTLNSIFPFAILLTLLISDYGISSYMYLHVQTFLFLCIALITENSLKSSKQFERDELGEKDI